MAEATLAFNILTKYKDTGADKAAKDMDRLDKSGSRMSSSLKKAGAIGAAGLAAGVVLGAKALAGMTKNAIEDDAAQRKLAVGLRNATGATKEQITAVEQWIAKQGVALGITDDELRPAFQRLVQATGDVGKAQKLAGIAMDASAGSGKSLKTVTEAIAKAQNGNLGSLSRLGVAIKDADGKTLSFDEAMKGMAKTFDGQASAKANTLEGKMDRLKVIFDETKETVGSKLIPVLSSLGDWFLNKGIPALQQFGDWFSQRILPTLKDVGGFIKDSVIPTVVSLATWLGKNRDVVVPLVAGLAAGVAVFKVIATVTKVWAAAQMLLNVALTANPIGLIVAAVAGLVVGLVIAYKKSDKFRAVVDGALRAVGTAGQWMWNNALKPVFGFLKSAFEKVSGAAKAMKTGINKAFEGIKDGVRTATVWVIDKVLWMAEKVLDGAVAAFGWAPKIGDKLKDARDKVADFRKDVNAELNQVKDEGVTVTVKANTKGVTAAVANFGQNLFATGGPVSGGIPGKDSVLGLMMPGEHVLTTDEVKKAGGHRGVFAIRRMLARGEFAKNGDVPAFATGGPVFGSSVASVAGLGGDVAALRHGAAGVLGQAAKKTLLDAANHWLKEQGGKGKLSAAQIARGQSFARSQVGKPYEWGGAGPTGYDCSGFVAAVLNAALGMNPYSRRGGTGSMPWPGFKPGKGSFSAGWFTGSPGHMAGSIGGMGIESAGGVGVRVGAAATGVNSFPNIAHFKNGTDYVPRDGLAYLHKGEAVTPAGEFLGTIEIVIKSEDGHVLHRKLKKVRRETRKPLGLE